MAEPKSSSDHASIEKQSSSERIEEASEKGSYVHDFGGDTTLPPPPQLTPEEEARIWWKVDLRLMPVLILMYAFTDRGGNIGNAKPRGLTDQLHLAGNRYSVALTMFFISYCLFECPANLVLKKFRPSRWLPGITIAWGVTTALTGLVKTYPQLIGVRIAFGATEAGLFPGIVYYLSMWYPRHMLQFRVGLIYGCATVAGSFSGILGFLISLMSGTDGKLGWSWIFIIEGCAIGAVGIIVACVFVDLPITAKFLTPEERAYVIWKKKYDNSSVGEEEHFEWRHLISAVMDWQVWLHILIYMSIIGPSYGIFTFLPPIVNGFGFSTAISQLIIVPPFVFGTIVLLIFALWSDRIKMRYPFILVSLVMCAIGFGINISNVSLGVKYFGTIICVVGSYAALPGIVCWLGDNLVGHYKRGVGMALQIGIGNFSGAIAFNMYRTQDAPRYILGHGLEFMFVGIGFVTVPLAVLIYSRINKKRDALEKEMAEKGIKLSEEEIRRLGDRAPDFRYTL